MLTRRLGALCLIGIAPLVMAEEWGLRETDERLSEAALTERLSGRSVTFFDDGVSVYFDDGRYTYTYANAGGTAHGYWSIDDAGAVCVEFVNGFARCDLYVLAGDRLVLLDEKGDRYPARPED